GFFVRPCFSGFGAWSLGDREPAEDSAPERCRQPRWPEVRVSAPCLEFLSWCPPPISTASSIHPLAAGWTCLCPGEYDVRARKKVSWSELQSSPERRRSPVAARGVR